MSDPLIQLTVGDTEEVVVIQAIAGLDGWMPRVCEDTDDGEREVFNPALASVANAAPYRTPYACLEALFRAVVTELFGVRA